MRPNDQYTDEGMGNHASDDSTQHRSADILKCLNKEIESLTALTAEIKGLAAHAVKSSSEERNGFPAPESTKDTDVKTIDLVGFMFRLFERFWLIALAAIIGTAGAWWFYARRSVSVYSATAKMYIVSASDSLINFSDLQLGTVLTLDYLELFKTWEVHELVRKELGLDYSYQQLQSMISVSNPESTRILYLTVVNPDPQLAADIANAYVRAAKLFITENMRGERPTDFSIALVPSVPINSSQRSTVIKGFLLGSALMIGLLFVQYAMDDRPRTPEDIMNFAGLPTLAILPSIKKSKRKRFAPSKDTYVPLSSGVKYLKITRFPELDNVSQETMNTFCTNLSYCGADIQTVLITSRYPMEGKSFISMNLMRSIARLGKRVVLVDTDIRASGIRTRYGIRFQSNEQKHGLSDYLAGHCTLGEVVYATNVEDAFLIPAGYEAPNPLRLLENERMKAALTFLKEKFDVVLVDSPPAGLLVDAMAIAKYCDGSVVVVSYRRGKRSDISDVARDIRKTGCKVLGAVMNNVNFKSFANRQYYYKSDRYSSYVSKKYAYQYKNPEAKRKRRHD